MHLHSHVSWLIDILFMIIEGILGIRFFLRFFGANASAPVVAWVYGVSSDLLQPFAGIFPASSQGRFVVEFSTLFAIIAYAILMHVINAFVRYVNSWGRTPPQQSLE